MYTVYIYCMDGMKWYGCHHMTIILLDPIRIWVKSFFSENAYLFEPKQYMKKQVSLVSCHHLIWNPVKHQHTLIKTNGGKDESSFFFM